MKKITFELTFNDIHTAISNFVKDKAEAVLDKDTEIPLETYIGFYNNKDEQVQVEGVSVVVKSI